MRDRLMQDILDHEGIQWVALIGPDALPIANAPDNTDTEAIVANWHGLDFLASETPAKMMIRTNEAILLSNRVDENRILLAVASQAVNVGSARSVLQDAAARILDLP